MYTSGACITSYAKKDFHWNVWICKEGTIRSTLQETQRNFEIYITRNVTFHTLKICILRRVQVWTEFRRHSLSEGDEGLILSLKQTFFRVDQTSLVMMYQRIRSRTKRVFTQTEDHSNTTRAKQSLNSRFVRNIGDVTLTRREVALRMGSITSVGRLLVEATHSDQHHGLPHN